MIVALLLLLVFVVWLTGYAMGVSDARLAARERDVIRRIDRHIEAIKARLLP